MKTKTIDEIIKKFNDYLNTIKFDENTAPSELTREVIWTLEKNFKNIYTKSYNVFYVSFADVLKHPIDNIHYNINIYFKVSSKRSDKLKKVSKTKSKYLCYIAENPIKFDSIRISLNQPVYELEDKSSNDLNPLKKKDNWFTSLDIDPIEADLDKSVDDIVKKIDDKINEPKIVKKIKDSIINEPFNRKMLRDDYLTKLSLNKEVIYKYFEDNKLIIK